MDAATKECSSLLYHLEESCAFDPDRVAARAPPGTEDWMENAGYDHLT